MNRNIYTERGYRNRRDYLNYLAEEFDVSYNTVATIASMLGPNEDFDGLAAMLEDEFG